MPLEKQEVNINFSQGLDTKTDPFQLSIGKFLSLTNTIFQKGGLLQKRNGYQMLAALPDTSSEYVTTFKDNLTTIGSSLQAFSSSANSWVNKGALQPLKLSTLALVRNNMNQVQVDTAISTSGLVCTAYTEITPSGTFYRFVVADSTTGQNIVSPQTLTATGSPKVFYLDNYFIVVFPNGSHLQYVPININSFAVGSPVDISTGLSFNSKGNFDGVVFNNRVYLAWNETGGGQSVQVTYLDNLLIQHNLVTLAGEISVLMSVTADASTNFIWVSFYNGTDGHAYSFTVQLAQVSGPTSFFLAASGTMLNLTTAAQNGTATFFEEIQNAYSYDAAIPTHFILKRSLTGGVLSSEVTLVRSVGIASKAFIVSSTIYFLSAYSSPYQPSYLLLDSNGKVISRIAYQNGGGYLVTGLPSVNVNGTIAQMGYLFKDLITSVNKNTNVPTGTQTAGIYAQTGVQLVSFDISSKNLTSSEIANDLQITGGFLWMYDGFQPVEQNFFVYPDSIEVSTSAAGGSISAQTYFYQVIYSWTDNQGNIFRSAPSIPVSVTTAGATSSNTIDVPTLRLTYKIASPVKIEIYRWSQNQQVYYQVTSISSPLLNDMSVDSVSFIDTLSDSTILGNEILYTTGGVIEDIGPPATNVVALFKSRLFLIDAEDPNLLWYSKQVIEGTPVEMSDLFTLFVAPTTGAQGNTGSLQCLAPMDDKLILFKQDAIYYITGNGPDNTGANNDFSDPIFITSTVGSANQKSIVFIPNGLMFQSDKGIWLLGRDLSTTYIGAPVEAFNAQIVLSALTIPGTNQVRFTLDNGVTLMYDYFYNQWGVFDGIPGISSTLYQSLHTFIDSFGRVFQEKINTYLDGSNPVLMNFTTGWLNLAGLQGFERAYYFYLLGTYLSPHKLSVSIAYDYNASPTQTSVILPINFSPVYGGDPLYGSGSPYGGPSNIEQWRVFLAHQKCQAFQISLQENYDSSFGVPAGAGLSLSGLDLVVGMKSGYPKLNTGAQTQVG